MTTDPIAAARALLDARPARILNYERDLMDMVATLADALEDEREARQRDEAENQRLRAALSDLRSTREGG